MQFADIIEFVKQKLNPETAVRNPEYGEILILKKEFLTFYNILCKYIVYIYFFNSTPSMQCGLNYKNITRHRQPTQPSFSANKLISILLFFFSFLQQKLHVSAKVKENLRRFLQNL